MSRLTMDQAYSIWDELPIKTTAEYTMRIFDLGYQEALKDMQVLVDHAEALTINTALRERK